MTYGTVRRATRAAKAAAVILTAVSCSVYDASLLEGGNTGSGGRSSGGGDSGTAGEGDGFAGRSGSAGALNGGSSGASAGEGGMMDAAGAMEAGGESSEGGNAGFSGSVATAGNVGTAGSGGTAGSDATAGSGGSAGTSGVAGSGGSPVTGCAKLSVPIDATTDRAHFVISLASATDLSNVTTGVVSMHVFVQAGAAGTIFNYVQDSQYRFFGVTTASRPPLKGVSGWQTLTFNVGAQGDSGTGIAKTDIRRVGIEINAAPDTTGWSNPTVVYVDSVTVTTTASAPALSFPLDTTATVSTSTTQTTDITGVMWLNSGGQDTLASGVTLTWQATCP